MLQRYGTVASAFEEFERSAAGGKITIAEFERLLISEAEVTLKAKQFQKQGSRNRLPAKGLLAEWVEKTTPEERAVVFASINPNGNPALELADFMCIHLHTAVLAARRLEHFRSWLFEKFGNSRSAFESVFQSFDVEQTDTLTREGFADGVQNLDIHVGRRQRIPCSRCLIATSTGKFHSETF